MPVDLAIGGVQLWDEEMLTCQGRPVKQPMRLGFDRAKTEITEIKKENGTMRKAVYMMMIVGMAVSAMAEAEVTVDVASAYVFRGITFNDSAVLQPGLSASGPIDVSVWGNLDLADYDELGLESGQFTEIDLAASYAIPLGLDPVSFSVGYVEYTYPSGGGDADRELSIGASLDVLMAPAITAYYGIDGAVDESIYVELSTGFEKELLEGLTANLGGLVAYASPDTGDDGFSHYSVSVGLGYGILSASVTYVGQIDDDVLPDAVPMTVDEDGSAGYDVEVYGMVGIATAF